MRMRKMGFGFERKRRKTKGPIVLKSEMRSLYSTDDGALLYYYFTTTPSINQHPPLPLLPPGTTGKNTTLFLNLTTHNWGTDEDPRLTTKRNQQKERRRKYLAGAGLNPGSQISVLDL
jgi:hypothetical protein